MYALWTCLLAAQVLSALSYYNASVPAGLLPDNSLVFPEDARHGIEFYIRRCCAVGEIIGEGRGCIPSDANPALVIPLYDGANSSYPVHVNDTNFTILYENPCGKSKYPLDPEKEPLDAFYLFSNGTLFALDGEMRNSSMYCFEYDEGVRRFLPYLCFVNPEPEEVGAKPEEFTMYPVGMLISEPFLLATFLVYALVPELQNLHGKNLMSHVMSLFIAYLFLSIVQIHKDMDTSGCVVSAFIVYFSFFASFFWLNVMCFDIWWTFSGLRPLHGSVRERERKKFIMYSTYAWGSSLVMLTICVVMDRVDTISADEHYKPMFGMHRCWFGSMEAEAAYFYGPIGLILGVNILLFILTAIKIMKLRQETAMLKEAESKRHEMEKNRQRFNLYLKLFIIMGVNWTMELISFAVGGPKYLWYITDICNTLQGVLIFLIFVWKEKVRHLLMRRLCPQLSRNANKTTSSKRGSPTRSISSTNLTHKTSVISNGNPDLVPMSTLVHFSDENDV